MIIEASFEQKLQDNNVMQVMYKPISWVQVPFKIYPSKDMF